MQLPTFKKRRDTSGATERTSPFADAPRVAAPPNELDKLEALVARAERAAEALNHLDSGERMAQLNAVEERVAALDHSVALAERLAALLSEADARGERLAIAHQSAETRIEEAGAEVDRIQKSCGELSERMDVMTELRDQMARFPDLQRQFGAMRAEGDTLIGQMREMTEQVSRLRAIHDDALRAHKHATARLDGIDQRHLGAASKMEAIERRAASAEQALDALLRIASGIPDVHHQLGVLKAMADQVTQKTAALEQQRDVVERAAGQVEHVVNLTSQIDASLRRQEEQARSLSAIDAKLAEVQSLHATVRARGDEISANQRQLEETERTAGRALADLRDEMRASAERFEMENRSLDAVSERIAELRSGVKESESRLGALEALSGVIAETDARAGALATQVGTISEDVARIGAQADRLRAVRDDVGELDRSLSELTERMERAEELRPTVEHVSRELTTLHGAHEAVRDGLEQVRAAYTEMTRLRESQASTDGWLADADVRMRTLQGQVSELERTRPTVEALRRDVDRVTGSVDAIESRSAVVDDLRHRLAELEAQASHLQERSQGARARMEAAESQFAELCRQADEAQQVAGTIGSVVASVEGADRRMLTVSDTLERITERVQELDGMGERMRLLGQELEQRQGALDTASEHLNRASALRRDAAELAQRLEDTSRTIATQLTAAESQASVLGETVHDLEGREAALGDVDTRLSHFEALLRKCELAQNEAVQALEQIVSRQGMIDAVQAQITHVSDIAERTADHVRSVSASRRDIEETRAIVEITRAELKEATKGMQDFAERKRQVEDMERRLARADAISMDVRSTLESIAAQRAVVDQALQRSGTLAFQMKQAEALAEVLRSECAMATRLRSAVDEMREEEDDKATS